MPVKARPLAVFSPDHPSLLQATFIRRHAEQLPPGRTVLVAPAPDGWTGSPDHPELDLRRINGGRLRWQVGLLPQGRFAAPSIATGRSVTGGCSYTFWKRSDGARFKLGRGPEAITRREWRQAQCFPCSAPATGSCGEWGIEKCRAPKRKTHPIFLDGSS